MAYSVESTDSPVRGVRLDLSDTGEPVYLVGGIYRPLPGQIGAGQAHLSFATIGWRDVDAQLERRARQAWDPLRLR